MKTITTILFILLLSFSQAHSAQEFPFQGRITEEGINVRTDSTVSAEIIYSLNKDNRVEVVGGAYDWYKIELTPEAPVYLREDLADCLNLEATGSDCLKVKVNKDIVNARLMPDENSALLGKLKRGEEVLVVKKTKGWYKIKPQGCCYGWIHQRFVAKAPEKEAEPMKVAIEKKQEAAEPEQELIVEGILKAKFITTVASFKLISKEGTLYLIKGDKGLLNKYVNRQVKIAGKKAVFYEGKATLLEVTRIEPLP
ncbi:MAG: SH3 domain-containing protein [Candidatus Omnitrophica bacterium]|nr:SH3 domain-containing protein [Candidatus Omnitrophota bacterium]